MPRFTVKLQMQMTRFIVKTKNPDVDATRPSKTQDVDLTGYNKNIRYRCKGSR